MILSVFVLGLVLHFVPVSCVGPQNPSNELFDDIRKLREDFQSLKEQCSDTQSLKDTITRLQEEINDLQKKVLIPNAASGRTCEELRLSDSSLTSGLYWIDPDGHGSGDRPIRVFCNMTSGSTAVLHDSEDPTDVGHCWDAGCYSRAISYQASMRQMIALTELSAICTQSILYECRSAPLEFNGVAQSWWTDRNGVRRSDFTGGNSTHSRCQCSLEGSCLDPELDCSCNAVSPLGTTDRGLIMDKTILPVTQLNFGRILTPPASGRHTLGRLECFGREFISPTKPSSCQDLWRSGHTLSGFYTVRSSHESGSIDTIFCDMTLVPGGFDGVSSYKHESWEERMSSAELLIRQQSDRVDGFESNLDQLNDTFSKQNQSLSYRIRKLESAGSRLSKDVRALSISRQKQRAELAELKNKTSGVSLHRMPASCKDLRTIGHILNGIYTIKASNHVKLVYCDMTHHSGIQQTTIGSVDVKTSPVYFYVQRNTSFYIETKSLTSIVLPFQIERSNVGGGMNIRTGIFTAPRAGTYVFNFGGIKRDRPRYVNIFLHHNETNRVASVYGSQHEGYFTMSLQSILQLKVGDSVKLVVESSHGGGIFDDKDMTTHFSGFLLDEELS